MIFLPAVAWGFLSGFFTSLTISIGHALLKVEKELDRQQERELDEQDEARRRAKKAGFRSPGA